MEENLYISDAALKEYENQDVFGTMDEFIEAMPPATRSVHILPEDIGSQIESYQPIASDEGLFGPLTHTFTHDTEAPLEIDDKSMWRVDDAKNLLKEQGMRDETQIIMGPYNNDPYEWDHGTYKNDGVSYPSAPGDFENDYAKNNFYRKFSDVDRTLLAVYRTYSNPVILTHRGFKTAALWKDIVTNLNQSVIKSSKDCEVHLKRSDLKNSRWTFTVKSSKSDDTHTVHLKVSPKKGSVRVQSLDLKLGCSCDFWKWQGPDHHAQKQGYLDRVPRSDGSTPDVRDPKGHNRVCKHVYAASELFLKYSMPKTSRTASLFTRSELQIPNTSANRRLKSIGLKLTGLSLDDFVDREAYSIGSELIDISNNI